MHAIETYTHASGNVTKVYVDEDAGHMNPRDNDNLGRFFTMERNYRSPDKLPTGGSNLFQAMADLLGCAAHDDSIRKALDLKAVWLPVWKYEHSGVAYSAAESNPFHCPWDSGQVGYVFVMRADVRNEYSAKRVTKAVAAKARAVLQAEVETYSQWANGEVYGYVTKDSDGDEVDSCWGFIGAISDALDAAKENEGE